MQKTTIELTRWGNHIKGYGSMMTWQNNGREVLDAIVDWSISNPDKKVYRHILYNIEEKYNNKITYNPSKSNWVYGLVNTELPTCELVQYLDIYYVSTN